MSAQNQQQQKTLAELIQSIKDRMKKIPISSCRFGRTYYCPIAPMADCDELAELGNRVMMAHGTSTKPDLQIWIAPKNQLTYGYVIGIVY
jgi:hypothetical protein